MTRQHRRYGAPESKSAEPDEGYEESKSDVPYTDMDAIYAAELEAADAAIGFDAPPPQEEEWAPVQRRRRRKGG